MKQLHLLRICFRGKRWLYFLPLFVDFVLLSLLNWYYWLSYDPESARYAAMASLQLFAPILVIWWGWLAFHEELDGTGREVLSLYDPIGLQQLLRVVLTWLWYVCHLAVLALLYSAFFDGLGWELLRLSGQSLFLLAFFYLASLLSGSTGIGMMAVLIYYFMSAFFSQDNLFAQLTIFFPEEFASDRPQRLLGMFGFGTLFLIGAHLLRRRPGK